MECAWQWLASHGVSRCHHSGVEMVWPAQEGRRVIQWPTEQLVL